MKIKRLLMALLLGVIMTFTVACGEDESSSDGMDYWDSDSDSYDSYDSYDSDSYDSGDDYNLGNYDYNDNGSVDDNEFQDAVNDYMDDNGY